eukprot:39232_1
MSSFQDTNMCYFHAITPPPTPTEITVTKRHGHQLRSVIISKHKISDRRRQSLRSNFKNKIVTRRKSLRSNFKNKIIPRLDVCNRKLYSHSENIRKTNTNANTKSKPLRPPKIALYTHRFNTSEDCNGKSPSSLSFVTLYPYETEKINDKHFTKTSGTPTDNYPIKFHDQFEGSPSESCPIPVETGKLFTNKFPKIEYIKQLSIIDSNNNFGSPDTPNDPPTTVIKSIISFPDIQIFEREQSDDVTPHSLYNLFDTVKLP